MFHSVSYYFGAFGTVWLCYKTQCKMGQADARVRATKSRRNFSQRTHRSTTLDPKLTFCCVLYYLGAFGTVWLPNKTGCKTSRSGAKVCAMKSCRNFSQRTDPIQPFGPLPHVSECFILFGCIWDGLLRYNTRFKTGQTCVKVRAAKSRRNFSQRMHTIAPIGL